MNFVVYGQARTGSTLLVGLLQSHPQVQCDGKNGEILNPNRWRRHGLRYLHKVVRHIPEPYVLWEAIRSTKDSFGFKLVHDHVPVFSRLLFNLHRLGWQLIHIQRRSLFDVAISRQVAQRTQHWSDYKPSLQGNGIDISSDDFLSQLQQCVLIRQKEFHTLAELPTFLSSMKMICCRKRTDSGYATSFLPLCRLSHTRSPQPKSAVGIAHTANWSRTTLICKL